MRFSITAVAIAALSCVGLGTAVGSILRGTVEHSFDDKFRLVRANNFVYQVDATTLSRAEKLSLEKIGSPISMEFPPGAIVQAWPAVQEQTDHFGTTATAPDAIVAVRGGLRLTGTMIPTPSAEDYYMQIGGTIFRIRASELAERDRSKFDFSNGRLTVQVPKSAIRFAWNTPSSKNAKRLPAAIETEPIDRYVVHGNSVEISGVVLHSYDDNSLHVQSGDTFILFDRGALEPNSEFRRSSPGERIYVVIPASEISLVWSARGTPVR